MSSNQSRFLCDEFLLNYDGTPVPFQPLSTCCDMHMRGFSSGAKKQRQCHYCNRYVCPSRLNRCSRSRCLRQKRRDLWCVCDLCLKHGRHYITDTGDVEVGGCRDRRNQQKQARNIQKIMRGYLGRKQMCVKHKAATKIQKIWRGYREAKRWGRLKNDPFALHVMTIARNMGVCDICGCETYIVKKCCGVKVCFRCNARFHGRCAVHQREELNEEFDCDGCRKTVNYMTSLMCRECNGLFCDDCVFDNDPLRAECKSCGRRIVENWLATKIQKVWRGSRVPHFKIWLFFRNSLGRRQLAIKTTQGKGWRGYVVI